MKVTLISAIFALALGHASAFAANYPAARGTVQPNGDITLQGIVLHPPEGFRLLQDAASDKTLLMSFGKDSDYVAFYVRQTPADMKAMFATGNTVAKEFSETHAGIKWQKMELTHSSPNRASLYLVAFQGELNGYHYYGYSRSTSVTGASDNAKAFLGTLKVQVGRTSRSLTNADYTGKKYYLGWGAAGFGDPEMMQNEVKYDVLHTHDIFTKEIGGNYIGKTLIGPETSGSDIRSEWQRLAGLITDNDMFVQYSSGHGSPSGLGVGVSYSDIRDNALKLPAKEIVIFTMACHSGGLVDAFDAKKSEWEDFPSQGRTLFVMGSSKKSETSSTGPGTDPEEQGGPEGSAGSAFGHALWKALIGHADGQVDGVKDGFLSLEEIRDFTIQKTQEVGGHTPQATGAYAGTLIMNKVPSKAFLESLRGGTEGLTDAEIMERIRALDAELRVQSH